MQVHPKLKVFLSEHIFSKILDGHKHNVSGSGRPHPALPQHSSMSPRLPGVDGIEFPTSLEIGQENCEMFLLWQSKNDIFSIKVENKNKDPNSQSLAPPF